jgi:glycine cleavage system H protein
LINAEPYAAGWLVEIAPADPAAIDGLLDAAGYRALTES